MMYGLEMIQGCPRNFKIAAVVSAGRWFRQVPCQVWQPVLKVDADSVRV